LFWHLVNDASWRQLAGKLHLDPKTIPPGAAKHSTRSPYGARAVRLPKPPKIRFRNQSSSW
jgi:hypothetical protein